MNDQTITMRTLNRCVTDDNWELLHIDRALTDITNTVVYLIME